MKLICQVYGHESCCNPCTVHLVTRQGVGSSGRRKRQATTDVHTWGIVMGNASGQRRAHTSGARWCQLEFWSRLAQRQSPAFARGSMQPHGVRGLMHLEGLRSQRGPFRRVLIKGLLQPRARASKELLLLMKPLQHTRHDGLLSFRAGSISKLKEGLVLVRQSGSGARQCIMPPPNSIQWQLDLNRHALSSACFLRQQRKEKGCRMFQALLYTIRGSSIPFDPDT